MSVDTVYRQAAIDAAIEAVDSWDGMTNIGRQKRIEKAIKALPAAQRWTRTSVKPPEAFQMVIIQPPFGACEISKYIPPRIKPQNHPNGYWGETDGVDYDYFDIYAWCPIPPQERDL